MRRVILLWNQMNTFGLSQDASLLESAIQSFQGDTFEIIRLDPLQPPRKADIVIHLEVPHPVWFAWAPIQIWMVNPEWCLNTWDSYKERFTQIWVKEASRVSEFGSKAVHIPWATRGPLKPISNSALGVRQALWILGGSQNKHIAARAVLPLWPTDFPLIVTTTLEEADLPKEYPSSVVIKRGFLEASELEILNQSSATHVAISAAEGFGFTAAQAEARSAAILLNTLPVYEEYYGGKDYIGFLKTPVTKSKENYGYVADFSSITTEDIKIALQALPSGESEVATSEDRYTRFQGVLHQNLILGLKALSKRERPVLPPMLDIDSCPPISVLTLTYNRREFIDLAFLNLLVTDYPKNKIQWVIVDDSDDPTKGVLDKIKVFEERKPGIEITYVPLRKKHTIGYKRNKAVQSAHHDICLHMDDDDVYPETSFRRRVAWLVKNPDVEVVGCTMIAMYDLQHGISAVNTPPWGLPQTQRVSEASFCFQKSYALMNPFPDIQLSEGEGFITKASENGTFLEIPPQQILVALNHGKNTSQRVIAGRAQTGCFWGWDKQFIVWLHGRIGVQVEDTV